MIRLHGLQNAPCWRGPICTRQAAPICRISKGFCALSSGAWPHRTHFLPSLWSPITTDMLVEEPTLLCSHSDLNSAKLRASTEACALTRSLYFQDFRHHSFQNQIKHRRQPGRGAAQLDWSGLTR